MRSSRIFHAVDSHTEGMPTRVITGGVGLIPGATMNDRRLHFIAHLDHIRRLLMNEPRGHSSMSGAILQPPSRPDCDYGVVYIEASGCLPMCGHGTMGVATVLVETGMVEVTEPRTIIRLDTPAGLVVADVEVHAGRAVSVTLENVPSFTERLDTSIGVEGLHDILTAGLSIMDAINTTAPPKHPTIEGVNHVHHVEFIAPGSDASLSRHAMAIHPGWFDRSPCGTGTCARMAELYTRGELPLHRDFINESFIGSRFVGRLVGTTTVGEFDAVLPTITGRACITGTAQYLLDPDDPFPAGFEF